jgi:hypothetical protein
VFESVLLANAKSGMPSSLLLLLVSGSIARGSNGARRLHEGWPSFAEKLVLRGWREPL